MSIKSDKWIKRNVENGNLVIEPFVPESINAINGKKIPSFGLTSYGYDIRLGRNFKVARHAPNNSPYNGYYNYFIDGKIDSGINNTSIPYYDGAVDVCHFDHHVFVELNNLDEIVIPPHGFILGHSLEKLSIPKNVSAVCMGKSTIARSGLIVIVTPLEPGWTGYVTLEIFNTLRVPIRLYSGIGITQVQFFESDEECETSYADRAGKYQNQPALPISPIN